MYTITHGSWWPRWKHMHQSIIWITKCLNLEGFEKKWSQTHLNKKILGHVEFGILFNIISSWAYSPSSTGCWWCFGLRLRLNCQSSQLNQLFQTPNNNFYNVTWGGRLDQLLYHRDAIHADSAGLTGSVPVQKRDCLITYSLAWLGTGRVHRWKKGDVAKYYQIKMLSGLQQMKSIRC